MNYNELSEKELREEQRKIEDRLSEIKFQKAEKQRKKREYHLTDVERTYHINHYLFYTYMSEFFSHSNMMTLQVYNKIVKRATEEDRIDNNEIYPCPECEAHSLYVGDWGDEFHNKKKVTCGSCSFTCPSRYESNDYDAWESFHNWLVKNGYLEK